MDPLTVLGVAGNIVQFVDFGLKIVSKGNRIYHSCDGSLAENNSLELITNDLLVIQTKLQKSLANSNGNATVNQDDEALRKILVASNGLAETLLERLNALKARGRFRHWNSFRQAIKSVCSKAEIDEMAQQLSSFRDELQTRILVSLSSRIAKSDEDQQCELREIQFKCESISGEIQTLSDRVSSNQGMTTSSLHIESIIRARLGSSQARTALESVIDLEDTTVKDGDIHQAILRAFEYASMEARHESIAKAHARTFSWILEDHEDDDVPWDNFVQWLRGSGRLYWLKGKAASGKSTLMKFLAQQHVVTYALKEWACDSSLTKAEFFFWALGTPAQKSQHGLLMSLLHSILSQNRNLTKYAIPSLWSELSKITRAEVLSLGGSWKHWTLAELVDVFETVVQKAASYTSIFLLIDGLDEFLGDPAEIASFFSRLTKYSHVKICVSGRPLASLEYEFKGSPGLQLQDLTRRDIHTYVHDKLGGHRHFNTIYDRDHGRATDFVNQIVEMSSGVFLWIVLVTKSLLEGLTNLDTIEDLEHRLNDLPSELDALYRSMLQSIQPSFYRTQASMLLQIVHRNRFMTSSLALSFADEPDEDLALSAKVLPISGEEAERRADAMVNRLRSRCRGLIEVQNYGHNHVTPEMVDYPPRPDQVQYLHLTVREFLEQPEVWDEIISWTQETRFNADLAGLRGVLLLVKKTFAFHGWGQHIASLLNDAMSFARSAESGGLNQNYRRLINEIDSVGVSVYPTGLSQHWTADCTGLGQQVSHLTDQRRNSTFLEYAIEKGLTQYVKSLGRDRIQELNKESASSFLNFAAVTDLTTDTLDPLGSAHVRIRSRFRCVASGTESYAFADIDIRPHPPMIKALFDLGLDPNEIRCDGSPWHNFVSFMKTQTEAKPAYAMRLIDTTKLFILYGADLLLPIVSLANDTRPVTAADEINQMFQYLPDDATRDLFNMLRTRGNKKAEKPNSSMTSKPQLADRITRPNQKRKLVDKNTTSRRRQRTGQ